ncbi:DUF4179 domain-containing protein [Kurthia sp. Dielmo]|uniref:DUF4179 domain-containing protein n=1 Tax=Kurthia sp. Dielmo TaxID=1033738 RepID=UPI00111E2037|nr:DUF4179 domain-containing protein [Kurthia sp. Dielmo]
MKDEKRKFHIDIDDVTEVEVTKREKERVLTHVLGGKQRKRSFVMPVIITLAALLILGLSSIRLSPTFAATVAKISLFEPLVTAMMDDKGLEDIAKYHYMEEVNAEATKNGYTVKITNMIADETGFIMYYEVNGVKKDGEVMVEHFKKDGKEVEGSMWSEIVNDKKQQYEFVLNLPLTEQVQWNKVVLEADFKVNDTLIKVPFKLKNDIAKTTIYPLDKIVTIDGQKIAIKELRVSPLRAVVVTKAASTNTKKILNIDSIHLKDEHNEVWGGIQNGLSRQQDIKTGETAYVLQSNYFRNPKELNLQMGHVQAIPKDDTVIVVDFSAEKVLKQPAYVKEKFKVYKNGTIHYKGKNSSIFSADASTLSGKTVDFHSSSINHMNKKIIVKTKYNVQKIKEPVQIEIEQYQHYLQGSTTIRIY